MSCSRFCSYIFCYVILSFPSFWKLIRIMAFKCSHCIYVATTNQNKKRHETTCRAIYPKVYNGEFECPVESCFFRTDHEKNIYKHVKAKHAGNAVFLFLNVPSQFIADFLHLSPVLTEIRTELGTDNRSSR